MKVIFLDIDGVLNHVDTPDRLTGIIGIDDECCRRLKRVVDECDASIVLISTWKMHIKDTYEESDKSGKYLLDKFKHHNIPLIGKTSGPCGNGRGKGIIEYLNSHEEVDSYIIIDDEFFDDYTYLDIQIRMVKSSFYCGGLTDELADYAIRLLNN